MRMRSQNVIKLMKTNSLKKSLKVLLLQDVLKTMKGDAVRTHFKSNFEFSSLGFVCVENQVQIQDNVGPFSVESKCNFNQSFFLYCKPYFSDARKMSLSHSKLTLEDLRTGRETRIQIKRIPKCNKLPLILHNNHINFILSFLCCL